MAKIANGQCLCGAVSYIARLEKEEFGACHCEMCRRWTGGVNLSFDGGKDVRFSGNSLALYDSSPWAERGFCSKCGSSLFYRSKANNGYHISIGSLVDKSLISSMKFASQIYIDSKPSSYEFLNKTNDMTEAEVIAFYSKKD